MPNSIHVRTNVCAGITIYGAPTCTWTQKQRQYFDDKKVPYRFVDFSDGNCPNFVEGFPTIVWTGYAEIPIPR